MMSFCVRTFPVIFAVLTGHSIFAQPKQDEVRGAKAQRATSLCRRLPEIKTLPFRLDHEDDPGRYQIYSPVYAELRVLGVAALPCLLSEISDETRMGDPRQAPLVGNFRVGDLAFLIVAQITGLKYSDLMMPPSFDERYEEVGDYAYYEWVAERGNRRKLHQRVQAWVDAHVPGPNAR